jgi:ketosteroid isomerase-like protein
MSQENAEEVARTYIWAFENDDDAFRDILHPEIEWFPFEENHSRFYGIEDAMRLRNQWLDTWDEMRGEVKELVQEGDAVVATLRVIARGKTSGAKTDVRLHLQFRVRDGKVVYVFEHTDRAAALKAAGLSE